MLIPGVHIETVHPPAEYEPRQIELAVNIASALNRGKLVLCIPPVKWPPR